MSDTTTEAESYCDAALAYAERGFFVTPVSDAGAALRPPTRNPTKIRFWWRSFPDAKVGCHLGRSGMAVIEVDTADVHRLSRLLSSALPMTTTDGCLRRYFFKMCHDCADPDSMTWSPCGSTRYRLLCGNTIVVLP
jgi:hypothetical protein